MCTHGSSALAADPGSSTEQAERDPTCAERPLYNRSLLRSEFVRELASVEDATATQLIVSLADDEDWIVRGSVAWALGKRTGPWVSSALFRMAYDGHPFVRFRAIASLGEIQALAPLERVALEESRDPRERVRSVHAMRTIDGAEVNSVLMSIADAGALSSVSVAAVAVLVHRNAAGIRAYVEAVLHCGDWRFKAHLVGVLHNLGREALPYLDMAMADADWRVRASAVEQCGCLNEPEAESFLAEAAREPHPLVRVRAVEGLGRSAEKHLPLLFLALSDPDRTVRFAAIKALGSRNTSRRLTSLACDPDPLVGAIARRVIRRKAKRHGSNAK